MTSRSTTWLKVLAVGVLLHAVVVTASPQIRRERDTWGLFTIALIITVALRLRRSTGMARRPWILLSAGAGVGLVASIGYSYPSWHDLVSYSSYVLLLASMRSFQKHRDAKPDVDAALDALLVMAATSVLVYAAILSHYLRDATIPGIERGGNVIYSIMTISLVTLTARLAVSGGRRNTAWYLLAVTVGIVVANDFLIMLQTAGNSWAFEASTWFAPLAPLVATAATLHPDAVELTHDPGIAPPKLSRVRLLMLGFALLIIPAVLFASLLRGESPDYATLIGGAVALALLALGRLTRMFRSQEAATHTETVLRQAGARLLGAPSGTAIVAAAVESARLVVASVDAPVIRVVTGDSDHRVAATLLSTLQGRVSTDEIDDALRQILELDGLAHVWVTSIDDPANPLGAIVVASSTPTTDEERRALEGLASQVALALRNAELTTRLAASRVERRFRSLIEKSSDVVFILDELGRVSFVSPAVTHVLGRAEESLVGTKLDDMVEPSDRRAVERALSWAARGGTSALPIEARLLSDGGDPRWFELVWRDLRTDDEIRGIVVNAREITDRKLADERMARSEARFRALVQHSSDMVIVMDHLGFVQYVSPSVPQVLGTRSDVLIGSKITEILGAGFEHQMTQFVQPFGRIDSELQTSTRHGKPLDLVLTVSDLRHEPAVGGIVINARDVTAHRTLQEDLRRRTSEDELTGLANRNALAARVNDHLRTPDHSSCAVLTIDLDDFKSVNDGLGTAVGDQVLFLIADRIRQNLRFGDLAARLTGDEFAVFLSEVSTEAEAIAIAERLIEQIGEPLASPVEQLVVHASIGVAMHNGENTNADELLRDADTALHVAKRDGKSRAALFETRMRADASDRFELKSGLRRGIYYGELVDLYQPKVSMLNDRITGSEVLVRWMHPERGLLGPNSFIPLAEETGLIVPLGQWVLEHAIANLQRWNAKLPADRRLDVSVNVSARQLEVPEAVDRMIEAVQRSGVDPSLVVLELTESLFVAESGVQREQIERLYQTGFRLSVDDFGTGYSSLRYLEQLPINEIKIDRSFIEGVDRSANKQAVLTRIVELAADLGYRTVAEGIEGGAELEIVRRVGCEYGQGYYFSRPISVERFEDLIGIGALV